MGGILYPDVQRREGDEPAYPHRVQIHAAVCLGRGPSAHVPRPRRQGHPRQKQGRLVPKDHRRSAELPGSFSVWPPAAWQGCPSTKSRSPPLPFAVMAIPIYLANWWKPKDIAQPTILQVISGGDMTVNSFNHTRTRLPSVSGRPKRLRRPRYPYTTSSGRSTTLFGWRGLLRL
ncbi:hypothetical protein B0H67DRAFT_592830 [Lasiosphaeris hirsuta]|uniref:Uncharacterized protein n=1 Tax=Lasiosphaeris hirsuta TaxID=260670 RepID=A0AA40DIM6_9PEZI|nr:hypothetical protein B0H67DRAFT_592830 [Lasiosphaeris hirsuta]